MLDVVKKYSLYVNLNKYLFYKNKICFLGYVFLAQKAEIKDK